MEVLVAAFFGAAAVGFSQAAVAGVGADAGGGALREWWGGRYATGDWFGVREALEDRGVTFRAAWRGNFLAVVDGGLQRRGGFDEEINFDLGIDAAKLTRNTNLEGLTFGGNLRWRDGRYSVNPFSGTDSTFRPSTYTGGTGWRLRRFFASYVTPELFGIPEFLEISGGWQTPADLFLVQPDSRFFTNNSIRRGKGINPNLPWSGSFSTWGGLVRVQPAGWLYAQSGMFLAYPFGTDPMNHGLSFQGYRKDPSLNGIFSVNEVGFTPEIGPDRLAGRYAAGLLYWGVEQTGFDGVDRDGNLQFYWQADQRLTRERPDRGRGEPGPSGKSGSGKLAASEPAVRDDQGLYWFSTLNFAPQGENLMPFYVLGGLLYRGLIPGRDRDQAGVAFAYGDYSRDAAALDARAGRSPREYQAVLEFGYRAQVNRFAFVQPVVQYIIRPGARGTVPNDTIIGLHLGADF